MLGDHRVVEWSFIHGRRIADHFVVATPDGAPPPGGFDPVVVPADTLVVRGGTRRSDSVRRALEVIPESAEVIVVHDAARPCASADLFEAVVGEIRGGASGAVPVVAVTDTIKRVEGRHVVETLDRAKLVAVQTPQAFRADVLRRAHAAEADATDDAALVEAIGEEVVVVEGEVANLKITRPEDLERAAGYLR
jgi:2-C-methyl-D-erythritol 4-phosphate cytidylyltransferase